MGDVIGYGAAAMPLAIVLRELVRTRFARWYIKHHPTDDQALVKLGSFWGK